jgi:group I intron endonuclease
MTTNKITGTIYVGQDSYNRSTYIGGGKILKMAIAKYGKENFEKTTLCKCSSQTMADEMEKLWISKLKAIENGYNILPGGKGNGYDKYVDTMSNSLKGENNPMHGKSVFDIWVEKYGKETALEKWNEINKKRSINGKNKGTKKVSQYDKDGTLLNTYTSMSSAAKETNTNINSIREVCNNKRKTAGKFIWKWSKD